MTHEYTSYGARGIQNYRPASNTTYTPGNVVQIAPIDQQNYTDNMTVFLSLAVSGATTQNNLVGVVSDIWPGFGPAGTSNNTSAGNQSLVLGTQFVTCVVKGVAGILVDMSGANATTLSWGQPLIASEVTPGYAETYDVKASPTAGGLVVIGVAQLPAAGIGSSIAAAALAQAARVFTVATPAAGDIVNTTIQSPYTVAAPGVVQKTTWSLALTTAAAATATTAGAAIIAYLNAQPSFSQYFTATASAGAVTVTVNALSTPFLVTYGSGSNLTSQFSLGISGSVANSLTTAGSVTGTGGTTYSAAGANFTGGTGYKGIIPASILGQF